MSWDPVSLDEVDSAVSELTGLWARGGGGALGTTNFTLVSLADSSSTPLFLFSSVEVSLGLATRMATTN